MRDKTTPSLVVTATSDSDGVQLSGRERTLISNFRAMKRSAQDAMVDLSEQYKRTLPALPTKLTLVSMADGV